MGGSKLECTIVARPCFLFYSPPIVRDRLTLVAIGVLGEPSTSAGSTPVSWTTYPPPHPRHLNPLDVVPWENEIIDDIDERKR